jgi:hypothetical protein
MRKKNQFDIHWFYKYYREKGGTADFNVFQMMFQLNRDVLNNIDKEFGLTIVQSKNGDFLSVVE